MLTLSPQVSELLLQATQSQDLEEALQKVLREYVDLKLAALSAETDRLEGKWGCPFAEFQEKTKGALHLTGGEHLLRGGDPVIFTSHR